MIPALQKASSPSAARISSVIIADSTSTVSSAADIVYNATGLEASGLSKEAFDLAWKGYHHLLNKKMIGCSNYLTICFFSQS
jgi:hypothetical protein